MGSNRWESKQVVYHGRGTWRVLTFQEIPESFFLLSPTQLQFEDFHPTQDKRRQGSSHTQFSGWANLSTQPPPSLFILPAGYAPTGVAALQGQHLLCRGSPSHPNTLNPFSWTRMRFPPLELNALSFHLSLKETIRLNRWLSFLPTEEGFLLLGLQLHPPCSWALARKRVGW